MHWQWWPTNGSVANTLSKGNHGTSSTSTSMFPHHPCMRRFRRSLLLLNKSCSERLPKCHSSASQACRSSLPLWSRPASQFTRRQDPLSALLLTRRQHDQLQHSSLSHPSRSPVLPTRRWLLRPPFHPLRSPVLPIRRWHNLPQSHQHSLDRN